MTKEKGSRALVLLCGAFALGALGGFCLAARLWTSGGLSARGLLAGYAAGFSAGVRVSLWEALWNALRWPLYVWVLGFTAFGIWMIPVMFALRGFFLCFCVAGLSAAAEGGLLLAFLVFGLNALVTLPVLFSLGTRSWILAAGQKRRLWTRPGEISPDYWLKSGLAFGCAACCAAVESRLLPVLLRTAAPMLGAG